MKFTLKKLLALFLVIIVILNLLLFATGTLSLQAFWSIIAFVGFISYIYFSDKKKRFQRLNKKRDQKSSSNQKNQD